MALTFPSSPTLNQRFPADPGTPGVSQWKWDGAKWNVIPPFIRTNNQLAYNGYVWTAANGPAGTQLSRIGVDGVTWDLSGRSVFQSLELLEPFDGVLGDFTLVMAGTTTPFSPTPPTNIFVSVGGVSQVYGDSYEVVGSMISFFEAPSSDASFIAISSGA
jgi:hypothetical protein